MPKICPKCNKEWPDEFMVCPLDGTTLVSKPQQPAGFSLNLGDANAISGGVNMSDNHSVSKTTVNTTTSNVDSHNVITNNITHVERKKTPEELKHEKELIFREECLKVFNNGIITSEGKRKIEDLRYRIGLDEQSANKILSEVAKRSERKSSTLSPAHQITFNNIKTAINANRLDLVNPMIAQMKAMVRLYSVEEIQFTYYMLLAVLRPKDCVEEYDSYYEYNYWQTFWSSIAYNRVGNNDKSAILGADIENKWTDSFPQDNGLILASVNSLLGKNFDIAKSYFDNVRKECYSPYLRNLVASLSSLLFGDTLSSEELKQFQKDGAFYTNNLFTEEKRRQEKAKAKQLADEKKRQEEEFARLFPEEKKRQDEAKVKRLAEARKRLEELKAKRLTEEEKRQEEAVAKRLAEKKKQQESAPSIRLNEMRMQQEMATETRTLKTNSKTPQKSRSKKGTQEDKETVASVDVRFGTDGRKTLYVDVDCILNKEKFLHNDDHIGDWYEPVFLTISYGDKKLARKFCDVVSEVIHERFTIKDSEIQLYMDGICSVPFTIELSRDKGYNIVTGLGTNNFQSIFSKVYTVKLYYEFHIFGKNILEIRN